MIASAVVVASALAAVGGFLFWRFYPSRAPVENVAAPAAPMPEPERTAGPAVAEPIPAETNTAQEPAAPPPLMAEFQTKKSPQGMYSIDLPAEVGDVARVFYHEPSANLFMAVVEPNGMRAIWKMAEDHTLERVLTENDRPGDIFIYGDSRGRLYAGFDDPGDLYRSADSGQTWVLVSTGISGMFWAIADDGDGTLYGAQHAENTAVLYRSTDDGLSWQQWKDFQKIYPEFAVTYAEGDSRFKLRHLHGVIYHNGMLFVGVGDVARFTVVSTDGGETWTKVWDEGFTAALVMPRSENILFGPDRLQAHGIAVYDYDLKRLREVWSPIPYGYAGYTYSMIYIDGAYYVGFHSETNEVDWFASKFGIITSLTGYGWFPLAEFGPLTNKARTDIFLTPAIKRIYMSMNGSLYYFDPLDRWWFDFHKPFGVK